MEATDGRWKRPVTASSSMWNPTIHLLQRGYTLAVALDSGFLIECVFFWFLNIGELTVVWQFVCFFPTAAGD